MKNNENAWRAVRLALSISALFAGATLLSGGVCRGGGGGMGYLNRFISALK